MTMQEINEKLKMIQEAAVTDNEKAMELLRELLIRLLQEDCFYILVDPAVTETQVNENVFLPYRLDVSGYPYFRVFSSEEAAESFVENSTVKPTVVTLETIPFIRFCKYWLMMGVAGFVLNDGQPAWCAVQFRQVLEVFFCDVFGNPDAIDKDFFLLLALSDHLYNGNRVGIGEDGTVNPEGEGRCFTSDNFPVENLVIRMDDIETTTSRLKTMYREVVSLRDDDSGIAETQLSLPATKNYPFESVEPQLTLKEADEEIPEKESEPQNEKKPLFKKPSVPTIPKEKVRKYLCRGAAAVLIICICAIFAFVFGQRRDVDTFKSYCDTGSYQEAVQYYKDNDGTLFRKMADKNIPDIYKDVYTRYMEGALSYEETVATLKILGRLPETETVSDELVKQVNIFETSRIAFEAGKSAADTMSRLSYWKDVAEEDEYRYSAVLSDTDIHAVQYKESMIKTVDALSLAGHRGQAKWCLELLCYWYPELTQDKDVGIRLLSMSDIEAEAVPVELVALDGSGVYTTMNPIEIASIRTKSAGLSDKVDLYIRWANTGAKVIEEVAFFVVPLNEFGEVLSNEMLFCARDVGPYKPSEGTPSDTWVWEDVWRSSRVSGAKLQTVIVSYTDGSVKIIEDPGILLT